MANAPRMTPIFGKPNEEIPDRAAVYSIIYRVPGMAKDLQVSGRATDEILSDAYLAVFAKRPQDRKPLYRVKITPKAAAIPNHKEHA